tara:strand:+ start:1010 stop:1900 length:891 start_codon:yes stop_codon:yes gene_type:complete
MADANEEQIEIHLDEPKKAKEVEIEIVKAEDVSVKTRPDLPPEVRELKFQLEQEKLARAQAEQHAKMAAQREYMAKNEVTDTNLSLINNAIGSTQQDTAYLKSGYREAMATGDYDRAAEIQQRMSDNAARLLQLENGKDALERQGRQVAPQYQQPMDPVEALAAQLSPRSAAWVRNNPQFATEPRLFQKMIAAHNLALADGLQPDTDDYFATVEETLRIRRPEPTYEDPMAQSASVTQRRSAPPAAPVSRGGNGTGSNPNRVTLSAAEREMAQMMGMTNQEYAQNKLSLQKEGKLN